MMNNNTCLSFLFIFLVLFLISSCNDNQYENWESVDCQDLGISFNHPNSYKSVCENDKLSIYPPGKNSPQLGVTRHYTNPDNQKWFFDYNTSESGLYDKFEIDSTTISGIKLLLIKKMQSEDHSFTETRGFLETEFYTFSIYYFEDNEEIFEKWINSMQVDLDHLEKTFESRETELDESDFGNLNIQIDGGRDYFIRNSTNNFRISASSNEDFVYSNSHKLEVTILNGSVRYIDRDSLKFSSDMETRQDSIEILITLDQAENRSLTLERFKLPVNDK